MLHYSAQVRLFKFVLLFFVYEKNDLKKQQVRTFYYSNQWTADSWHPFYLAGQGLEGATVGVIGLGRIGLSVAKKLVPFNIKRLLYYSRSEKPEGTKSCSDHFM